LVVIDTVIGRIIGYPEAGGRRVVNRRLGGRRLMQKPWLLALALRSLGEIKISRIYGTHEMAEDQNFLELRAAH
jgi:hypothetical protein